MRINEVKKKDFWDATSQELPSFAGDYTAWESFKDQFDTAVIKDTGLAPVQHIQYLKSCLTDEAALLIKNLKNTAANFATAWKLLESRYGNPHAIINAHLRNFFNLTALGSESLEDLKNLRDQSNEVVTALKNQGRPVEHWDDILVYFIVSKLDKQSRKEWENSLGDTTEYPTYDTLERFLNVKIRFLEAFVTATASTSFSGKQKIKKSNETKAHVGTSVMKCPACSGNHALHQCEVFRGKTVIDRNAFTRENSCCINCLKPGHLPRACASKNVCRHCKRKHHTLLHRDFSTGSPPVTNNVQGTPEATNVKPQNVANAYEPQAHSSNTISCFAPEPEPKGQSVLLATAWARVKSTSGRSLTVRILLDQGSQSSFITESIAQALRAPRQRISTTITSLSGEPAGTAKTLARLTIEPCRAGGPVVPINALVLQKLTSYTPAKLNNHNSWEHLRGLELADSRSSTQESVQMLVGADVYGAILLDGLRKGPANAPVAQNTIFGWIVSGLNANSVTHSYNLHTLHVNSNIELDAALRAFWEVEDLPRKPFLSLADTRCESHFATTHARTSEGRYVVRLPFKSDTSIPLGESKTSATASFYRLERRLNRNPEQASAYKEFMLEYEKLGHMRAVQPSEKTSSLEVYFPHHPVIRAGSSTTKLRVVFNASSPTSNGMSLNEHLLVGPNLQGDLPSIILRWRSFRYVYTADMAKMFRQIQMDRRDVDYQRILWRSEPEDPLLAYQLLTVTYGTASAPFLANRVVKQIAIDEGSRFPLGVPILEKNIYVDDVLFGADDMALARQTRQQVTALLTAGGLHLRKWMSNHPELLNDIQAGDHERASNHPWQVDEGLKVLGILWNPREDSFRFNVNAFIDSKPTKRQVLATIARIFDPLGWASPVVISAKILMQSLWKLKCGWDDTLPEDVQIEWHDYCSTLRSLDQLVIPRWTGQGNCVASFEIHGFSDASNVAYAAVVYLRVKTIFNEVQITMLTAKTKVAPVKCLSVPRLELAAAELLSRVILNVQASMDLPAASLYCWTDSTIVLAWLKRDPTSLKTFVANRVSSIVRHLPEVQWRHVPTQDNPADCASRGISADKLTNHPLWWHGPSWLRESLSEWPDTVPSVSPQADLEEKTVSHIVQQNVDSGFEIAEGCSSWPRLLRVTSYVKRFVSLARRQIQAPQDNALTVNEISEARDFWIKRLQALAFVQELRDLQSNLGVSRSTRLRRLDPFLDESNIIRVGGRLRNSNLPTASKFPIILPKHRIAELIIGQAHLRTLHGGVQITLRVLRQQFRIIGARNLVKHHIMQCVPCVRQRAALSQQKMGDLPAVRVTPARPFSHSGIDYAGPILTRITSGRGHKSHKSYIAIFVCLATRAIHLELVSDYSATAFLAAFDRYSSRRGLPSNIYSDNGTTFQGADKELTESFRLVIRNPEIRSRLATDGTAWHFQPPYAPHFGGIWEAGVKSVKHHLRRILGSRTPTFEEFTTLLCQIEAVLNSRPIGPLTDNVEDFDALTPGHFLVGSSLITVPKPSLLDVNENRLSRWQQGRRMLEQFWRIWSGDYLNTLQQRYKWSTKNADLQIGDLVLMRNANLPPSKWELGRVVEGHRGRDGHTRVVSVKTAKSTFKRPITQICRLPVRSMHSQ